VARASRPRFSLAIDSRGRDARATLDQSFRENQILGDINEAREEERAGFVARDNFNLLFAFFARFAFKDR
jgi:hypothetical protein